MCDYRQVREQNVEPGHIWLIKQPLMTPLSSCASAALASANVVIYDRALAPLVAAMLPLGSYAEAWSPDGDPTAAVLAPRAVKFAAEGWRVVQLVQARQPLRLRLREVAVANGNNAIRVRTVDEMGEAEPRALIVGPLALHPPVAAPAFTANGLAG